MPCDTVPPLSPEPPPISPHSPIVTSTTPQSTSSLPPSQMYLSPSPSVPQHNVETRKSHRHHKLPTYLSDYVHSLPNSQQSTSNPSSLTACFSLKHHFSPADLSPNSQLFALNITHDYESSSYEESALDPAWQAAMTQEFAALHDNNTWSLMPLPVGKKEIGCRWVYKIKYKADGSVERYKIRLVVKGYTQHHGIDYRETFSPVVKMTIVRALIVIGAKKK